MKFPFRSFSGFCSSKVRIEKVILQIEDSVIVLFVTKFAWVRKAGDRKQKVPGIFLCDTGKEGICGDCLP